MKTILLACLLSVLLMNQPGSLSAQGPFTSTTKSPSEDSFAVTTVSEFNVRYGANRIIIDWATEENQLINQFIVEKSEDGKSYQTAAIVFATEKKDVEQYNFADKVIKKTAYYRIVVILKNGEKEYLDPVMIQQKRSSLHS